MSYRRLLSPVGQGMAYHSTFQRPLPFWLMSMEPNAHSGHLRYAKSGISFCAGTQ